MVEALKSRIDEIKTNKEYINEAKKLENEERKQEEEQKEKDENELNSKLPQNNKSHVTLREKDEVITQTSHKSKSSKG